MYVLVRRYGVDAYTKRWRLLAYRQKNACDRLAAN